MQQKEWIPVLRHHEMKRNFFNLPSAGTERTEKGFSTGIRDYFL